MSRSIWTDRHFLLSEKRAEEEIYPPSGEWFAALDATPDEVKVVILGQDPYHGPGQAHGLSFLSAVVSVSPPSKYFPRVGVGSKCEPPVMEISLAGQHGVLMLNSVLTVERGRAGSHQGKGWGLLPMQSFRSLIDDRCRWYFCYGGTGAAKGATIDKATPLRVGRSASSPYLLTGDSWGVGISVRPIASSWSIMLTSGLVLFCVTAHYRCDSSA